MTYYFTSLVTHNHGLRFLIVVLLFNDTTKRVAIMAVFEGVKLSKTQAGIAKAQGMLSGVPDLFLPLPRGKYHGLYIEMKHGSNTLTENQKKFLQNAANVGFAVSVCYSAQEAIKRIEDYYKD